MTQEPVHPMADATLDRFVRQCESEGQDEDRWVFGLVPKRTLHVYNARDSHTTDVLAHELRTRLNAEPDIKRTWETLVRPASEAIAQVEAWGVCVSRDALDTFDMFLESRERDLRAQLDLHAPNVNWNSRDQVADYLYGKLGLTPPHMTDSGKPSTDEDALVALKDKHPVPAALSDLRSMTKLRGNYAVGLRRHIRGDGRVHTSFNIDGAGSGRTSSSDPNLQNIPSEKVDKVLGKMARDVFVAPKGSLLVSLDYSQLELRVAAALSGDKAMMQIFLDGVDFHKRAAQLAAPFMGKRPEDVTEKERRDAKTIVFGKMYGRGTRALAHQLGCSVADAARYEEAIMGAFSTYAKWCEDRVKEARTTGCVWTYDPRDLARRARRRPLVHIADPDEARRSNAENASFNTPVQGTASDYCVASLIEVVRWLVEEDAPAKVVLTVHDQIVGEVREDFVNEYVDVVQKIMTSFPSPVPLETSVDVGERWGSLVDLKSQKAA